MNQHSHFYKALQHSKFQSGIRLHTKSNFNMQRFFSICFCILHILLRGLFPLLTKLASNLMTTFWPLQAVKLQSFWFFLGGISREFLVRMCLWWCWNIPASSKSFRSHEKKLSIRDQICKTWTKWAVHYTYVRARRDTSLGRSFCQILYQNWNFLGVQHWHHADWTDRCRVICWKMSSHWNWQSKNYCANTCTLFA